MSLYFAYAYLSCAALHVTVDHLLCCTTSTRPYSKMFVSGLSWDTTDDTYISAHSPPSPSFIPSGKSIDNFVYYLHM